MPKKNNTKKNKIKKNKTKKNKTKKNKTKKYFGGIGTPPIEQPVDNDDELTPIPIISTIDKSNNDKVIISSGRDPIGLPSTRLVIENDILKRKQNLAKVIFSVCKNSVNCIQIGMYREHVKYIFSNFDNFDQAIIYGNDGIKYLGSKSSSSNGFVILFNYHYVTPIPPLITINTQTIMKFAQDESSDNLFYEYYVGKYFINKYINNFLCFTETYNCFKIIDTITSINQLNNICENNKNKRITLPPDVFLNDPFVKYEPKLPILWNDICTEPAISYAIMIQFYSGWISFNQYVKQYETHYDEIESKKVVNKLKYIFSSIKPLSPYQRFPIDLVTLLYQIYFVLNILKHNYTHYDLHSENVGLYKLYDGNKYIIMHYHKIDGIIISFKTENIAKIIDYGRNYFSTTTISSSQVKQDMEASANCMLNSSVNILTKNVGCTRELLICPNVRNISHDLRLAKMYEHYLFQIGLLDSIKYDNRYGTVEELFSSFNGLSNRIVSNVEDMAKALEMFILTPRYIKHINKKYSEWQHIADIHIYEDTSRTYEFIPINNDQYME
jgi:hypothetical protein